MKYFLHDTNAFQDEKVSMIFFEFGYEGLGLFYTILEKLAAQEKPVKTEVLKKQLQVGKRLEKCWSFMEEIGVISSSNGETFNERILSYSEKYLIKNEKTRKRVARFREQQTEKEEDTKNVTRYSPVTERVRNADVTLSNISKVKESKGIEGIRPTHDFEIELSELDIGKAIEYIHHTKQKDVNREFIQTLFNVFKTKNFTGAKFYRTKSEIISHFFESIKFEKFEVNGTHKPTSRKNNGAGEDQLIGSLKKIFNTGGTANTGS